MRAEEEECGVVGPARMQDILGGTECVVPNVVLSFFCEHWLLKLVLTVRAVPRSSWTDLGS